MTKLNPIGLIIDIGLMLFEPKTFCLHCYIPKNQLQLALGSSSKYKRQILLVVGPFDLPTRRADNEKASSLWWILLEKNEQGLQCQVGVSRTDRTVVE